MACGHQFRSKVSTNDSVLWNDYLQGKQTISELSASYGVSASTIKRRLSKIHVEWQQPKVSGRGVIHIDATYFGRNNGLLLVLESSSGQLLYMQHISHEHISDYETAILHLESCGYDIKGVVLDGNTELFSRLQRYPIQMCQFHFVSIIRRKLTKKPQLEAGRELLNLAYSLKNCTEAEFRKLFEAWDDKWKQFLREKTTNPITGKSFFTHKRLRYARLTVRTFLTWLFTFETVSSMPNTNNLIEGTFTDLKKNLQMHPGMSSENRIKFINGFFLAYNELHNTKGDVP